MDVSSYISELQQQLNTGVAKEHAYRPALKLLFESTGLVTAINDPARSEHGNPDFIFKDKQNLDLIRGYGESKDININLDIVEKSEQMRRYLGYSNLVLTNGLDFRFFRNGEKYFETTLGYLEDNKIFLEEENIPLFSDELKNFLEKDPEKIRNAKRLSEIMGGKARRIRENINLFLKRENDENNAEIEKIYKVIKDLLVHDLSTDKFSDMYAQTLVYGLFIARYSDKTLNTFTRQEARDLVPASNPFLRQFFDHIAGNSFDKRLAYIVDELCAVFQVSDIKSIIERHFKQESLFGDETQTKDPIIHFYEDFLKEYDPDLKKKMGAYYTPVPIVKFIVRAVDDILKNEFGLTKGLSDASMITRTTKKYGSKAKETLHRVQILDPAVGTATFLNELVKYIFENNFKGQEGRWTKYVDDDLIPRLYGFELMMAPYTIAHLKLGMTLKELGYNKDFDKRLGIYLTNTLEEGVKRQLDLLTFGLQEAISKESQAAAEIKHDKPIMVIIGNPPYSVSSNNKGEFIEKLMKDYKKDLNERNIQLLSDDYIKFIRFSQDLIEKNEEGIIAMITNNSFIDGIIHRQMRKSLINTFDQIYVLDLHGNSKKKEICPDDSKDENVFNIQQGVSINIFVKKKGIEKKYLFSEIFGKQKQKYIFLDTHSVVDIEWKKATIKDCNLLNSKDMTGKENYEKGFKINDFFNLNSSGVKTHRDNLVIDFDVDKLSERIKDFINLDFSNKEIADKLKIHDSRDWKINEKRNLVANLYNQDKYIKYLYRPMDIRYIYYDSNIGDYMRYERLKCMINNNLCLITRRTAENTKNWSQIYISNKVVDINALSAQTYCFPLYIFDKNLNRIPNLNEEISKKITKNYTKEVAPENFIDYIYAVLNSPHYKEQYKYFLKSNFPRILFPKNEKIFWQLVEKGKKLRELHLMDDPELDKFITTYSISGNDKVEKVEYKNERVYINNEQYFGDVSEVAWNFYIGGYQPAQKWLKDRKGRVLSNEDIEHYQKIIKILVRTDEIMKEIDKIDFI